MEEPSNVEVYIEYINGYSTKEKLIEKYNLNLSVIEAKISYGREEHHNTNYWKLYLNQILNP